MCIINETNFFCMHKSDLSGDYIIEEVKGNDNKIFRRLIFLSNQFVIQSEALVKVCMHHFDSTEILVYSNYLPSIYCIYSLLKLKEKTKKWLRK